MTATKPQTGPSSYRSTRSLPTGSTPADLVAAVSAALEAEERPGEVTVVVTSDEAVAELNLQYRDTDGPTDVLSFPAQDPTPGFVSAPEMAGYHGDIIIALPYTERQAAALNRPLRDELRLLAVHGTLHLLGYDHGEPDEEARMWAKQDAILAHLLKSFGYAGQGIAHGFRTQRNMRVEAAVGVLVIAAGVAFRITAVEWAVIFVCIGLVLSAELVNTVTELAVDLLTQRYHPMAKAAKDAGAGAVLIAALASVAVGVAIFGPRLWRLIFGG